MVEVEANLNIPVYAKGIYHNGELEEIGLYIAVVGGFKIPTPSYFYDILNKKDWDKIKVALYKELDQEIYQNRVDKLTMGE